METKQANEAIAQLMSAADPEHFRLKYEQWNDMLYITLCANRAPSSAIQLQNGWLLRVNRETGVPFGFIVENAMWQASQEDEDGILFDLIEHAEFTDAEPPERKRMRSIGVYPAGFDALTAYFDEETLTKLAAAQ
jgi:hypothetical protein